MSAVPTDHILLVEDDPSLASLLQIVLDRSGYAVTHVAHGRAALEYLHRKQPRLVISDIMMPDGDGIEVLNFVRQSRSHPPLIAMSGAIDSRFGNMLKMAGALGATRMLPKPFLPDELLSLVRELVGPAKSGSAPAEAVTAPSAGLRDPAAP